MSKGAVLISGAAGGIGRATVQRFLESGYEVAAVDLNSSIESIRMDGFRGRVADVRKPELLAPAIDELLAGLDLRHVVALAGGVVAEEELHLDRDLAAAVKGFNASIALNLTGAFAVVRATLDRLTEASGDRSVTLCSSQNALAGHGAPAYSAAKAGLIGMMHALSTPLGRRGIRINVVAPGSIRTAWLEPEPGESSGLRPFEIDVEEITAQIPLGRVGEPSDVAEAIEAVADRMTFVSDQLIGVDGGALRAGQLGRPGRRRRLRRWWPGRPAT